MLSLFEIAALLIVLTAVFAWANQALFRLPLTIGLLVMGLVASGLLLALDLYVPGIGIAHAIEETIAGIDVFDLVMNGMLAFLLFAGALHVDLSELASVKWAIALMATLGVCISTAIVGFGSWWIAQALGLDLPLAWALVFGALISPTDPVAVLSLLKTIVVPPSLEAKIAGESLFNDGVGVVVFTVILAIAAGSGDEPVTALHVAELFFVETGGGVLLGFAAGFVAYKMMKVIDQHTVEVLITLALVTGTYALAHALHLSGPIAVVVAGLLIGNRASENRFSENTTQHLFDFWDLIDGMLNAVLFLLIGLEVIVLTFDPSFAGLALAAIPLVLFARLCAVAIPVLALSLRRTFTAGVIPVLTWGGVRGGISVALALSLPDVEAKPLILLATYAVVVFSVVVQGLTVTSVVDRVVR